MAKYFGLTLFFLAVIPPVSMSSASMQVTPGVVDRAVEWQVTQGELLRGVNSFRIIVEEPSNDEQACGITRDALRLAAARPVLDGALAVVDGQGTLEKYGITSSPMLYVNVTGYQLSDILSTRRTS